MKKTLKVLMMLGCFPMMLSAKEYKKSESLNLDKGWEFAQVGRNEWLPATVPGTVHQDLISHHQGYSPVPVSRSRQKQKCLFPVQGQDCSWVV